MGMWMSAFIVVMAMSQYSLISYEMTFLKKGLTNDAKFKSQLKKALVKLNLMGSFENVRNNIKEQWSTRSKDNATRIEMSNFLTSASESDGDIERDT